MHEMHARNVRTKAAAAAAALVAAYRSNPQLGPPGIPLEPLALAVEHAMDECGWGLLSQLVRDTFPHRSQMQDLRTSRPFVAQAIRAIATSEATQPDDPFAGLELVR